MKANARDQSTPAYVVTDGHTHQVVKIYGSLGQSASAYAADLNRRCGSCRYVAEIVLVPRGLL